MKDELSSLIPVTDLIRIRVVSDIGASRSFDDLPMEDAWLDIPTPPNSRPSDKFCAALIHGESLAQDGIHEGDMVVFRLTFSSEELRPGRLLAVLTPYGLLLKHVWRGLNGKIRLVSANPSYKDLVLDAEDVTIRGIAVQVIRSL